MREVVGSNPTVSTISNPKRTIVLGFIVTKKKGTQRRCFLFLLLALSNRVALLRTVKSVLFAGELCLNIEKYIALWYYYVYMVCLEVNCNVG